MEVNRNWCHLGSLVVLIILILFPVKCLSTGDTYKHLKERSENTPLESFYTIDYDSFVGLMGKRRAAPALNDANHIPADLLQRETTGVGCPSAQTFLQKTGFKFTNCGKQRSQPSLRWETSNIRV